MHKDECIILIIHDLPYNLRQAKKCTWEEDIMESWKNVDDLGEDYDEILCPSPTLPMFVNFVS